MLRLFALFMLLPVAVHAGDFLDPNQAFRLGALGSAPGPVELVFDIRPGHYMYREAFRVQSDRGAAVSLDAMPAGERKFDEAFQRDMEIYRGTLRVRVQLLDSAQALRITGQGCADKGLCYAPMTSTLVASPNGIWTLQPGADPAGEFGAVPGSLASPKSPAPAPTSARLGVLVGLFLALWTVLGASRRF